MQDKNHIDEIFKKGLGNYSEQPSDNIWAAIERKMWLKNFWKTICLFLLGIGLVGVLCTLYLSHIKNKIVNPDKPITEVNNPISQSDDSQLSEIKNDGIITAENDVQSASNEKNRKIEASKINNKTITESKPTAAQHNTTQNEPDVNNASNKLKSDEDIAHEQVQEDKTQVYPLTQKQKDELFERIKQNEEKIVEKIEAALKTQENQNITEAGINDIKKEDKQEVNTQENTEIITENKNEVNNMEGSLNNESEQAHTDSVMNVSETLLAETQNKPSKPNFEVLFYTQPSYVTKSLKGLSDEDIRFRKENEKNFVYLNYGMEFRCYISNFYLQTGITQMQSGEKNNYEYPYIKSIDTSASHYDVSITSYPDPQNPGNTIIVFDSAWVSVADSSFADMKLKNLNTIKYMDIPLNIGYVLNYEKHQWGISGGLSYALLSYASMAKIDKESHEIVLSNHNDKMLRKNLWSYNLGLAYGYSVSGNTRLFVQTAYKRNINSVFNNTSYKQYYNFVDMKIGVMMKF